jgi:hypothetical protein
MGTRIKYKSYIYYQIQSKLKSNQNVLFCTVIHKNPLEAVGFYVCKACSLNLTFPHLLGRRCLSENH